MRKLLLLFYIFLLAAVLPLRGAGRDLALAREMLEDAIIRDDADGIDTVRERLSRIIAETDDRTESRDANYLAALSAFFESFSAYRDAASSAKVAAKGIHYADRAIELDPQFADAWVMASSLRFVTQRAGLAVPNDPPNTPNRFARALELDAKSPAVAFVNGMVRSINPNGAANPEGVRIVDDLAQRLDADRAATGRRFGLWDAQAHAWTILVRIASDEPRGETLRPMAARLLANRPDFALGTMLSESVAEHRFVAPPAVTWQSFMTDAANDGKNPKLPDVVAVDRAETADRFWYRVTFREPLPRSFGVNVVVNRSGDRSTGMRWWGGTPDFRFDRLVTAWISRDGDRYFGRIGVTDEDGARGARFAKIASDVALAMTSDERSVIVGVPRDALGITDKSAMIVAGGSHLVWNDDATIAPNSR